MNIEKFTMFFLLGWQRLRFCGYSYICFYFWKTLIYMAAVGIWCTFCCSEWDEKIKRMTMTACCSSVFWNLARSGLQVVRALLQIAGADAGQPPPEILGTALQASGELDSERGVADLFLLSRKPTQSLMSWITNFVLTSFFKRVARWQVLRKNLPKMHSFTNLTSKDWDLHFSWLWFEL